MLIYILIHMSIYQHGFSKMWRNVCTSSDFSKSLVSLFISQSVLCWCEISECMLNANWLDSDITVSPINRLSWNSSDKSDMIRGSIVGWLVDNQPLTRPSPGGRTNMFRQVWWGLHSQWNCNNAKTDFGQSPGWENSTPKSLLFTPILWHF